MLVPHPHLPILNSLHSAHVYAPSPLQHPVLGCRSGAGEARIRKGMTLMSHQHPLDAREFTLYPLTSMQLGLVFDAVPANSAEAKWDGWRPRTQMTSQGEI